MSAALAEPPNRFCAVCVAHLLIAQPLLLCSTWAECIYPLRLARCVVSPRRRGGGDDVVFLKRLRPKCAAKHKKE